LNLEQMKQKYPEESSWNAEICSLSLVFIVYA